jgi:octaprenyl-diphosphate synthase
MPRNPETDVGAAASLPPLRAEPRPGRDPGPVTLATAAAAGHPGSPPTGPRHDEDALHALDALVEHDLAACNRTIVARMDSPVALIPQLAAHIVAAGGKRLRPLLTLAAARLCGYTGTRHTSLAACVEFIHTATLLHDDVVDESALRRGLASANAVFGNKASVLVGDFLFARAFQLMVEDGSLKVLAVLSRAAATIAEGEVLQLATQNDLSTTEDRYLEVVQGKTAALFAAACQVGAIVADRPEAHEAALASYGSNLGIAFQLVDDALDYAADQATLGKTVGDDFREGKITLPVLAAYQAGGTADQAFWQRTIEHSEQQPADLDHAMALMARHGAIATTLARATRFANAAKTALAIFPDSPIRRALVNVADYTVNRAR